MHSAQSHAAQSNGNKTRSYQCVTCNEHTHAHNRFILWNTFALLQRRNNHLVWLFAARRGSVEYQCQFCSAPSSSVSHVRASKSCFPLRVQVLWAVSMRNVLQWPVRWIIRAKVRQAESPRTKGAAHTPSLLFFTPPDTSLLKSACKLSRTLLPQGEFFSDFSGNGFYSGFSFVPTRSGKETFVNKRRSEWKTSGMCCDTVLWLYNKWKKKAEQEHTHSWRLSVAL